MDMQNPSGWAILVTLPLDEEGISTEIGVLLRQEEYTVTMFHKQIDATIYIQDALRQFYVIDIPEIPELHKRYPFKVVHTSEQDIVALAKSRGHQAVIFNGVTIFNYAVLTEAARSLYDDAYTVPINYYRE